MREFLTIMVPLFAAGLFPFWVPAVVNVLSGACGWLFPARLAPTTAAVAAAKERSAAVRAAYAVRTAAAPAPAPAPATRMIRGTTTTADSGAGSSRAA